MAKHEKPDTETDQEDVLEPGTEETHVGHKAAHPVPPIARFKRWYVEHKLWAIPASVLVFVLLLAAIPPTRYALAGTAVKKDLTVKVIDATANTPVSGALVSAGGVSVLTDGSGRAKLPKVKAGNHSLTISKKYYKDGQVKVLVPIFSDKAGPQVQLSATGRQVKITITNKINKKPLSDVNIAVADITAKTDKNGTATIVLPAGKTQQSASLKLDNYIGAKVNVKISNNQIQQNSFGLTPSGKVYFLSKLSGKIDIVKTNLDGTDRQTVLAGTGNEDEAGTVLLASRDWKYLALQSKRAGSSDTLYLIDTSDDSLSTIDEGDAEFNIVGWIGHNFTYTVSRRAVQDWQPKKTAIKAYNAETKSIKIIDQTDAQGDQSNYAAQYIYWTYSLNDSLLYLKSWSAHHSSYSVSFPELSGKQAQLIRAQVSDGSQKVVKSWDNSSTTSSYTLYSNPITSYSSFHDKPNEVYFIVSNDGTNQADHDEYDDGKLVENGKEAEAYFNTGASSITYLVSPSGNNTFWSEPRDGKNTLFIGDTDGESEKQIATLSDYSNYGWYTDDYVLVSKNSSELYVMARGGDKPAVKISDYHKPSRTYYGYGGGYGGL